MTVTSERSTLLKRELTSRLDRKLAGYLTAGGLLATGLSSSSEAAIFANTTEQLFGINQEVNIDFNNDGQVDFQIDHDRVELQSGSTLDYLQVDKNDVNGASLGEDPLPINVFGTFPPNASLLPNDTLTAAYAIPTGTAGDYPAALLQGASIGPATSWDFQEGTGFGGAQTIRANRLIDEDAGQVDMALGGLTAADIATPTNGPNFLGLGGEVRYLGVRMEFASNDQTNYGWIGIRIDNEADATGAVTGWGYNTTPGEGILAGQVPEPTTILTAALGAAVLVGGRMVGRMWKK